MECKNHRRIMLENAHCSGNNNMNEKALCTQKREESRKSKTKKTVCKNHVEKCTLWRQ